MTREEAIEVYNGLINTKIKEAFEFFAPELAESEDERIRKWLVNYFTEIGENWIHREFTCKQIVAYLEKQKEQEHICDSAQYEEGFKTGLEIGLRKQKEQKPAEINVKALLAADRLASAEMTGRLKERSEILENPEKYGLQKPAWSEEDVDMLNSCISSIEEAKENRYAYKETDGDTSYDHEIAWLKSLRPSWKPSEEQIQILRSAIDFASGNAMFYTCNLPILESLYNDLKKL